MDFNALILGNLSRVVNKIIHDSSPFVVNRDCPRKAGLTHLQLKGTDRIFSESCYIYCPKKLLTLAETEFITQKKSQC